MIISRVIPSYGDFRDSRYDTSRFEEARVADAIAKRLHELDRVIAAIEPISKRPTSDCGAVGAIVHVREEENELFFFILPSGGSGGYFIDEESGVAYQAVSTESPIGRALIGKHVGDVVVFSVPLGKRTFKILDIG